MTSPGIVRACAFAQRAHDGAARSRSDFRSLRGSFHRAFSYLPGRGNRTARSRKSVRRHFRHYATSSAVSVWLFEWSYMAVMM